MKEIKSLQDLIAALDKAPRAEVPAVLNSLKLSTADLSGFASWKDSAYTRNCLHKTATYELILLCWSKKCITAIHDHGGQDCWVYQIAGELVEKRFKENETGKLVETNRMVLGPSGLTYMEDNMGYHQLCNETNERGYTLHLYASPIDECDVYKEETNEFETKEMCYDTCPEELVGL